MAIAFYIPDQNKLLASYNGSNGGNSGNTSASSSNANTNNTHQQSSMPTTAPTQQQPTTRNEPAGANSSPTTSTPSSSTASTSSPATGNSFRANISIPLATYPSRSRNDARNAAVGCWELFAQVLCYALGCYRATMLNPAAIEISFEISTSSSNIAVAGAADGAEIAISHAEPSTTAATSTQAAPTPPSTSSVPATASPTASTSTTAYL